MSAPVARKHVWWLFALALAGCASSTDTSASKMVTTDQVEVGPAIDAGTPEPIAICGNSLVESGEQCDDGNTDGSDGCANCQAIAVCGNGQIELGEQCDDANTVDGDGCSSCRAAGCGDHIVQPTEACDDGNQASGDGCSSYCQNERCGDGFTQLGEQCDDANQVNGDGCTYDCRRESCGDGVVQTGGSSMTYTAYATFTSFASFGSFASTYFPPPSPQPATGEQCDDGNAVSGDGCSSSCRDERCGDGIEQSALGEECDDGNLINGDGCNSACDDEKCGNGVVDAGEDCDDGNKIDCDGCMADCTDDPPAPALELKEMGTTSKINDIFIYELNNQVHPKFEDSAKKIYIGTPGPLWVNWNRFTDPAFGKVTLPVALPVSVKFNDTPDLIVLVRPTPQPVKCEYKVKVEVSWVFGDQQGMGWKGEGTIPKGYADEKDKPPGIFIKTPRDWGAMPHWIDRLTFGLTYTYSLQKTGTTTWETGSLGSTSNELLVTYDRVPVLTPPIPLPTLKRTRYVIGVNQGNTSLEQIYFDTHKDLVGYFGGDESQADPWKVLDANRSDCNTLSILLGGVAGGRPPKAGWATFMVGAPRGTVKLLFPTGADEDPNTNNPDLNVYDQEHRVCPGNLKNEKHKYAENGGTTLADGDSLGFTINGVWNWFEAVLQDVPGLDGKIYPGGVDGVWTDARKGLCSLRAPWGWGGENQTTGDWEMHTLLDPRTQDWVCSRP